MTDISENLRKTMRQWTTGVSVVCSKKDGFSHGMTVNSFTSISLDPPIIVITLANQSRTCNLVKETGLFSVSILRQDQKHLADHFSGKDETGGSRLENVPFIILPAGMPALSEALAVVEGKVIQKMELENSTLFLAEVVFTDIQTPGRPLVYHNREYFSL